MLADDIYESCLPVLKDEGLEEEEKTDKLEDYVRREGKLSGKALETAVLDILWRYRTGNSSTPGPSPQSTIRKSRSPAPWQQTSRSSTPVGFPSRSATTSPAPSSFQRPSYMRLQSTGSPLASPKASPRFGFSSPHVPHSPNLDAYDFQPGASSPDIYGDYGSNEVDWLVNDDGSGAPLTPGERAAQEWVPAQTVEMTPYDLLRSVLRDDKTDAEIEQVLEASGYDLSTAIASFSDAETVATHAPAQTEHDRTYLVGKSMAAAPRPATPVGQQKSPIVCRYWLSTGQCLRADCRFSHDLSHHVCKYWLQGNCLAGSSCIFSHDPALLLGNMSLAGVPADTSAALDPAQPALQDHKSFPSLGASQSASPRGESSLRALYSSHDAIAPPPGFTSRPALAPEFIPSQPRSRHQSPAPASPASPMDDGDAFPSLSAAGLRGSRKHHGKRGQGLGSSQRETIAPTAALLADVLRMAPAPVQPQTPWRTVRGKGSYGDTRENGAAAQAVPVPERIPWLETGARANKAYLKARQEAIKHGGARNKFLQSAAQAWTRNDVRAAKTLSVRGQSENQLMRDAHRAAAKALYEDRNSHLANPSDETFVDLHALHPAEAVSYLAAALVTQRSVSHLKREEEGSRTKFLYAIVGTGHHSRGGRDKVGRAVRAYLAGCRYAFREFGVPGDRPAGAGGGGGGGYFGHAAAGNVYQGGGGILGIDCTSGDLARDAAAKEQAAATATAGEGGNVADEDDETTARVSSVAALAQPQAGKVTILRANPRERAVDSLVG